MESNGEKLYRLSTVADRAGFSLRTVQKHIENGDLKVVRVGPYRRPRVKETDMQRYLGNDPDPDDSD